MRPFIEKNEVCRIVSGDAELRPEIWSLFGLVSGRWRGGLIGTEKDGGMEKKSIGTEGEESSVGCIIIMILEMCVWVLLLLGYLSKC